jgi:hypothetical protein
MFVFICVSETAEHNIRGFKVEYLGEYESEKALTRRSGAQMGLFNEKKPEVENFQNWAFATFPLFTVRYSSTSMPLFAIATPLLF